MTTKSKTQSGKRWPAQEEYGMEESKLMKLFEHSLKDIYWVEKTLTRAIPKMQKKTTSDDLKEALENHLGETEGHVEKLEKVFSILGKKPSAKKCDAMTGILKEAEEVMDEADEGAMRDAGIIASAQKVEHYEIASYGTLCAFAKTLANDEVASIFDEILSEEKAADEKLTEVAESAINIQAAEEVEADEEEE
jgi:ferritin-like metal-binding protein YciE